MHAIVTRGYTFSRSLVVTAGYFSGTPATVTGILERFCAAPENRTYRIPIEDRGLIIEDENRVYIVPPPGRC